MLAVRLIPSKDEWYQAAYYGSGTGVCYDYPTQSNTASLWSDRNWHFTPPVELIWVKTGVSRA